jgi:hypothetical protein
VVIGAGQLGTRHLQSLALFSAEQVKIEVVEPFEQSQLNAKKLYEQVSNEKSPMVSFLSDIEQLSAQLDLVIVATSANVRADVVKQLLTTKQVKHLILEKVLFQRLQDFDDTATLIEARGVKTWVNCPRRVVKPFANLADVFDLQSNTQVRVSGSQWGLACNAIHMLDFVALLAKSNQYDVDTSALEPKIFDSKRAGFIEIFGELNCNFLNGVSLQLVCQQGDSFALEFDIEDDKNRMTLIQGDTFYTIENKQNGQAERFEFNMPYQSELTYLVAKDILSSSECGLTPYLDSAVIHRPFIGAILAYSNEISGTADNEILSIT